MMTPEEMQDAFDEIEAQLMTHRESHVSWARHLGPGHAESGCAKCTPDVLAGVGSYEDQQKTIADYDRMLRALRELRINEFASRFASQLEDVRALLRESKRKHYESETDSLNNCPLTRSEHENQVMYIKHECDCGADEWNAKVDAVLAGHLVKPAAPAPAEAPNG